MKQSGVLLHSKVKKSPLQSFIDIAFHFTFISCAQFGHGPGEQSVSRCIQGAFHSVGLL